MALSPGHKFGQIIGDLLEEVIEPTLRTFCTDRGLYLDKKGPRPLVRPGQKVSWEDKYGNSHDLDFVIERGGSDSKRGRPIAFIESAWRRYTKHSRNKAQEIQGAILPIFDKHAWDHPYLAAVLAGVFTQGALDQMKSAGFDIVLFPYNSIIAAFKSVGINCAHDETTSDADFNATINRISKLTPNERIQLKSSLIEENRTAWASFILRIEAAQSRTVVAVHVISLRGSNHKFGSVAEASEFVLKNKWTTDTELTETRFDIIVRYSNNDKIDASFSNQATALDFLNYIDKGGAK